MDRQKQIAEKLAQLRQIVNRLKEAQEKSRERRKASDQLWQRLLHEFQS